MCIKSVFESINSIRHNDISFVLHLHIDVVGPLLLNASLLLEFTADYSDWLVQVTELIDSWQWRCLLSFDDCVIQCVEWDVKLYYTILSNNEVHA